MPPFAPRFVVAVLLGAGLALAASARAEAPAAPAASRAVRSAAEVVAYPIAGGKGSASIYFDAALGSPEAAMTLLVLQPGAAVPEHTHETSVEMLYVIEGEAEMTLEKNVFRVGPGSAVRIPMKAVHSARVVSDRPLRAVQIYTPAGPEQRFKAPPAPPAPAAPAPPGAAPTQVPASKP